MRIENYKVVKKQVLNVDIENSNIKKYLIRVGLKHQNCFKNKSYTVLFFQ